MGQLLHTPMRLI